MKKILFTLSLFTALAGNAQTHSLDATLSEARAQHKQVLLRFSGSDWCIPCIRMEKEIFADSAFHSFEAAHLIPLQADFPRQKKHRLPREQEQANEALAERYNAQGSFPLTLLLDANGKVIRRWDGLVSDKSSFLHELEALGAKQ
jgi:thioredoxin-related protein